MGGAAPPALAMELPPGYQADAPIGGIRFPTTLDLAPNGDVFVAERDGLIRVYQGLEDPTPSFFTDLSSKVHGYGDRGLLGMKLDPAYPTRPYLYVSYSHDAPLGGTAPVYSDTCPGEATTGCTISGRLSRFQVNPADASVVGQEQVLIESWCQQFTSHSVGDIEFDATGALYMSGGEGASYETADYGQFGNPCGDPLDVSGPNDEGGALRAQDLRTSSDPIEYSGSVIRIPSPDALVGGTAGEPNAVRAQRIAAHGLRNPFRLEFRPGSTELYIGDVGWHGFDEINRFDTAAPDIVNFGWPCYEGPSPQPQFDVLDIGLCESLYATPVAAQAPFFSHPVTGPVFPGDPCSSDFGSAISGLAFHGGGAFPSYPVGTLFFANAARGCVWAMPPGIDGRPDPAAIGVFAQGGPADGFFPVDIAVGPAGELLIPSFWGHEIVRIRHFPGNAPPVARMDVDPAWGDLPLTVTFDATASSDQDGDPLTYAWDLDGDGLFDDGNDPIEHRTYTAARNVQVSLRVNDPSGAAETETTFVYPGNHPPDVTIQSPSAGTRWAIGDLISFSGLANDQEDGALDPSRLDWEITLEHCPSACHSHPLAEAHGTASGSFTAPVHEHPSHLLLRLSATDMRGLSGSRTLRLDPRMVNLDFASEPDGIGLTVEATTRPAPFSISAIAGSSATISAPAHVTTGGRTYDFSSWSDGGARSHTVTTPGDTRFVARYLPVPDPEPEPNPDPEPLPEVEIRLVSRPFGIPLRLDGTRATAESVLSGTRHVLAAPRRIRRGGHVYLWRRWSDGGARVHAITPEDSATYRALYRRKR